MVATNQAVQVPNKVLPWVDSADKVTHAASSATFFTNPFEAECGIITACSIKLVGCSAPYTGDKLFIDAASGKVESI